MGNFKKEWQGSLGVAAAIFSLGLPHALLAQGLENTRLDQKLNERVVRGPGEKGALTREGLDLSFTASIAYDDNIFQTPDNETSSLVLQVEPIVGWTAGERDKTWVRFAYEATGVLFLSEADGNRVDHRVNAEGAVKFDNITLAYSARWARLGNPSADVGGTSDRNEYGGRVAAIYQPKGKLSYEISAERSVVDLVEEGFFDSFQSSFGVSARYRYSPKTSIELGYRLGRAEIDESGDQTFHQLGGEISWSPRKKINLSLQAGLERRDYEDGGGTDPYLAARLNWYPRSKTSLFGEVYYREEASAAVVGENFNLTGFRIGFEQALRDGWSFGAQIGRENTDYFAVIDQPESGREDTITYFRPRLSYAFAKDSSLSFLYQWSQNDSNDSDFGYDNHQFGVAVNHRF